MDAHYINLENTVYTKIALTKSSSTPVGLKNQSLYTFLFMSSDEEKYWWDISWCLTVPRSQIFVSFL